MKVAYLAGWGRSGSTLLGAVLEGIPGWLSVGELRYLLEPGTTCGCGRSAADCPFWAAVRARAEQEVGPIDPGRFTDGQRRRLAPRRVPALVAGRRDPGVEYLADTTMALYRAAAAEAGAHVVVDGSKHPGDAALLAPRREVHLVHLVRDPRATGYSWSRRRRDGQQALPARTATVRWLEWNLLCDLVARRVPAGRRLTIRYEDVVDRPAPALGRIAGLLGDQLPADVVVDGVAHLGPNHILGANPAKFRTGDVPLVADDEWRTGLGRLPYWLITGATLPLLLRFGYVRAPAGRHRRTGALDRVARSPLPAPGPRRQQVRRHPVRSAGRIATGELRRSLGTRLPSLLLPRVAYYEGAVVVDLRTPTGLSLYRYGPLDPTFDLVRSLVGPDSVVVDAGANVGLFSVAVALAMRGTGTVYAFEPVTGTRLQLLRNVVASGCPQVRVLPYALGASAGSRTLVAMPGGAGLSSFSPEQPELGRAVEVEVRRLDDALEPADRRRVAMLKLDVEGAEADVLAGASALVAESRPLILTEVEDGHLRRQGSSAAALREALADLGYRRMEGPEPPNELYAPDPAPPAAAPAGGNRHARMGAP